MESRILPKLDLNITNKCNFRCIHCAFDSGVRNMPEMSLSDIERILKDTKELGGKKVDITGGEPTIRKDILEIVSLSKKYDYKTELVTNGSTLDNNLLEELKKIGLDGVAISLDGSTSRIYNQIRNRNKNQFLKTMKSIGLAKKKGFYTKINVVVFKSNLFDIPNIINLGNKIGVNEIGLYYFTPVGRGRTKDNLSVDPVVWLKFIRREIKPLDNGKTKISLEIPLIERGHFPESNKVGCIVNREQSHLQILPDLKVYPCAILSSYNLDIGNLSKESVKKVWRNYRRWSDYSQKLDVCFKKNNGFCVDFKNSFRFPKRVLEKYEFVCPLRKFQVNEI